jgi:hypothetical protein
MNFTSWQLTLARGLAKRSSVSCTRDPRTERVFADVPLTAYDGGRRIGPTRSRRWRGFGRGGIGATWPTGATGHDGGWCARGAAAEHGWRRWMAAAVTAHTRSRRGAGEHGPLGRAWVSRECGDAFPVLNLVGDGAEGGDRRWGSSGSHRRRWRHGFP